LGGGALAAVYSAREWTTGDVCAVKFLRHDCKDRLTAIKLLQREARAGLAVKHPHLVRFRRAHVTREPYFLVMDMLAGESLRRRLRRDYLVTLSNALWICRQCAEALSALHRKGFIHGDVKPDNIRLVQAGTAILIDLGFAHRPGENARLRRQGYVLGTVNYLAPELCCNDEPGDTRSDIFSLGVTLFEMLTGQLPYPTGPIPKTLVRHASDPPADLQRFNAMIPRSVATFMKHLLDREPWQRPAAGSVVQQLIALEIASLGRRQSA
jgi:serine/threonine protein kinase